MRSLFSLLILPLLAAPAHAHWGHVGELAGHGHAIAVGAAAAAAALAAALYGWRNRDAEDGCDDEEQVDAEEEPT